MEWYGGGIAEAVTLSRKKGSIFVVYIEGPDDKSKRLTELIDTKDVSEVLGGDTFVAIKVEANSVPHQQFSEIYKQTPIPSLYFIGKSGAPLEIITELNDSEDALGKIGGILVKNGGVALKTDTENLIKSESASTAQPTVAPKDSATKEEPSTSTDDGSGAQEKEEENVAEASNAVAAAVTAASNELSTEDKLRLAQDLIVKKRALKKAEEEENEKLKEIERRKLGQDVQKMKRWQQDQELKHLMEEREKEKREQNEARDRIRRQIEEDKREKAVRFATPQPAQHVVDQQPRTSPRSADTARLQFRLPDGTSHTHDFASSARLNEVVDFVRANLRLPYAKFVLSTTFPRREFSDADSSSTLTELQLVPNAVVLVLPATTHGGAVTPAAAGQGLTGMLWYILAPILNFLGYLKGFFVGGGGGNAGSSAAAPKAPAQKDNKRSSSDSQNTTDTGKPLPKRRAGEAAIRRQGNIHRLTDRDSDDDNNTWNGNSTQQM